MIRPKVLDSIGITKGKRVDLRAAQVGLSDDGADGSRDVGYGGHVVVSDGRRSLSWLVGWMDLILRLGFRRGICTAGWLHNVNQVSGLLIISLTAYR